MNLRYYTLVLLLAGWMTAVRADADADAAPPLRDLPDATLHSRPIRAGDTIRVAMKEDPDVQVEGEVSAEGLITVPYFGRFLVGDQMPEAAEVSLAAALTRELYQAATISITVLKRAPTFVYVYGAVKKPGKVSLPDNQEMFILQALAEAGGITSWSTPREAYILRRDKHGNHKKITADILVAFENILSVANHVLLPQDVVVVPSATGTASILSTDPMEVIVTGQVKDPGLITFAPGERRTFIRAIFKAGDFTRFANRRRVRFIRYHKDGVREVKEVNAEEIIGEGKLDKDFDLEAGDMIVVDESRFSF